MQHQFKRFKPIPVFQFTSVAILGLMFCSLACRHATEPPPPPGVKSPRDYSWSVDTIQYGTFQTAMGDMWGSSQKDIYVVGHCEDIRGMMYHYDGQSWRSVKLSTLEGGGISGAFDLTRIFGFAEDNIFVVGALYSQSITPPFDIYDSSFVMQFDGHSWTSMPIADRGGRLAAVWGSSPTDIWAGGVRG
jgi:hypothetical protein